MICFISGENLSICYQKKRSHVMWSNELFGIFFSKTIGHISKIFFFFGIAKIFGGLLADFSSLFFF